jgi:hypothetical protein
VRSSAAASNTRGSMLAAMRAQLCVASYLRARAHTHTHTHTLSHTHTHTHTHTHKRTHGAFVSAVSGSARESTAPFLCKVCLFVCLCDVLLMRLIAVTDLCLFSYTHSRYSRPTTWEPRSPKGARRACRIRSTTGQENSATHLIARGICRCHRRLDSTPSRQQSPLAWVRTCLTPM